ncbi:MAG TPA: single-stranded-DNA-specific exonuclease RecJ [Candidatus Paceibacterota bacterium]|nr:single-stranded-DNA-specific exonuclease RecJ [Candidatus Paceibacterota bacterium]HPT40327.1 single-stranded-DNA-specific exonuclease RecJ [Candidatus Paceibacterota bacterium]
MNDKIWKTKESAPIDFFNSLEQFPRAILQIFWNRGITNAQKINAFLNPSMKDLYDPFLMKNMREGAGRIVQAIKNNEKLAVYGDYDTDGICSCAILVKAFERFGFENYDIFIPNRFKGGYGLTNDRVKQIADLGVKLLITFDCGITDVDEVEFAKGLGMEVLIFDHHLPHEKMPGALIVDAHQIGDEYPFKYLAATGLAYKTVQAVADLLEFQFKPSLERQVLELVAIATIADQVPMIDENRVLVKFGLEQLRDTSNIGLKALLKVAGISDVKKYDSYHGGFVIAPRLNAVGRVRHKTPEGRYDSTDYSFELLTTDNENEAQMWAEKINELNTERMRQGQKIYAEIQEKIKSQGGPEKIIFMGGANWSNGIVGIIAGKLKDEWHRPVLLYSQDETVSVGSSRSIPNCNLVELLDRGKDLLVEAGGHKLSAGFTIKNENIDKFHEFLIAEAAKLKDDDLIPVLDIDAVLEPEDVSPSFWALYRRLEPFGKDNLEPVFLMKDLNIFSLRTVGNGSKHIKMIVEKNKKSFDVISFNSAEKLSFLQKGMKIDLVFTLKENEWQGRTYLDLELVDVHPIV